jgi:DNA polymerase I
MRAASARAPSGEGSHGAHPDRAARVAAVTSRPPAVLAIDGNSLAHRAWHSTRTDERAGIDGVVTGAFASMLASVWRYGTYTTLLVGFDDRVNRRREDFPEYKAQRAPTPSDLRRHMDLLIDHLRACEVAVRIAPGAEADDVLAATVDGCLARGWHCDLVSADRDLLALVAPTVRLLRPRQRFADLTVEDEAGVRERHGVDPARYLDLAALRGDPSDGLEGAKGIGPARAARLVRDHGSIVDIYRALPDLPPRIAASLREARDRVERNMLLMSPLPHIDAELDDAAARGAPLTGLARLLDGLGFSDAAQRLRRAQPAEE